MEQWRGWSAPTVVLVESDRENGLWERETQRVVLTRAGSLRSDPRVAHVLGLPRLLQALGPAAAMIGRSADLPPQLAPAARQAITPDGRTGVMLVVLKESPESHASQDFSRALRESVSSSGDVRMTVGGGSAILADFDREMLRSKT